MGIVIEKRLTPSISWQAVSILLALLASFIISALLLKSAGADIGKAGAALWDGAFGGWRATWKTLVKATPLMLTGIAAAVAFRARIWNIGAEGQLYAGAIFAYWVSLMLGSLPALLLVPLLFAAGAVGGSLYGGLAGYLRARFEVSEVLSTVMLNYIVLYFLSFMLTNPWRDPSSFFQQSPKVVDNSVLPNLMSGTKLHIGFLVALAVVAIVHLVMTRSSLGYEIRAVGLNEKAARFKGIDVKWVTVVVMLISGGIAGIAGVTEVFGVQGRLNPGISVGFGFTGIIIAVLALLNPVAIVFVAILIGGSINGGIKLQVATGVPSTLIDAIQAIILLFYLAAAVLARYKFRIVSNG
jgi:ABC-type uncharacterized transport system permease subunit